MVNGRIATKGKTGFGLAASLMILGTSLVPAHAADYLRGAYSGHQSTPQAAGVDWAGMYVGIHAGITSGKTDPGAQSAMLAERILPDLSISNQIPDLINLRSSKTMGTGFGSFAGINYLWDDVVLGVEMDYTRTKVDGKSSSDISRTLGVTGSTDEWVTRVRASSKSTMNDYGTLRGRVGWAAGNFLPFITAGLALGNLNSTVSGFGSTTQYRIVTDPVSGLPVRQLVGSTSNNATIRHRGITYGGAIGAGVDMAFFSNFFVRAEWQYIQFASGGNRPELSVNAARVAGALKF